MYRTVLIRQALYARFKGLSPAPKVSVFIEEVLTDWSNNATPETQARVAAAMLTREEANHQRYRAARNAKKAEKLAEKERRREKREAEQLAQKAERQAFYEAEAAKREADKAARNAEEEQRRAERTAEKAAVRAKERRP